MTNSDSILVDFEELTSDGDRTIGKGEEYYGFIWDFNGSYGGLELTAPGGFSVPQAYSLSQEDGSYFAYDQYVGTTELNLKRSDSSDFYFESGLVLWPYKLSIFCPIINSSPSFEIYIIVRF